MRRRTDGLMLCHSSPSSSAGGGYGGGGGFSDDGVYRKRRRKRKKKIRKERERIVTLSKRNGMEKYVDKYGATSIIKRQQLEYCIMSESTQTPYVATKQEEEEEEELYFFLFLLLFLFFCIRVLLS